MRVNKLKFVNSIVIANIYMLVAATDHSDDPSYGPLVIMAVACLILWFIYGGHK